MGTVLKTLGGLTLLVVLLFGSARAMGAYLDRRNDEQPVTIASERIPVDDQVVARSTGAERSVPSRSASPSASRSTSHTASPAPRAVSSPVVQRPEPADSPYIVKRFLPIDGPIRYGEYHWDESNAPATGRIVVAVDLETRVLSVYRGGYEIGATAVLLGTQDHPTPLGEFPVLEKKRDNISSIYNVPMPYTMRLTWDGISIHSSQVENGYASHGCIGAPDPFAARLFELVERGTPVIITRGRRVGIGDSLRPS